MSVSVGVGVSVDVLVGNGVSVDVAGGKVGLGGRVVPFGDGTGSVPERGAQAVKIMINSNSVNRGDIH